MVKLFGRDWKKSELLRRVGQMDQLAGIRSAELADGKACGSRVLEVWTGTGLRFQVNAERALDIAWCEFNGHPLSWRSPTGDVHPAYYEPHGLGWLRSFTGGLLTTCGLDQFGAPSQDDGVDLGLHGRVSNLPASQINHRTAWVGEEYRLEISGEVRQAMLFGENLVLRRRISTALGSNRIRIEDAVTNEGFAPGPHMLLYHFNLGFPLLSADTRLNLSATETLPRDADAQTGLAAWNRFQEPTPGYHEQVFIHRPETDDKGIAVVELNNPQIGLGLRWTYATVNLPYLMEWKMMGEGSYVIGIEPANCNGLGGRAATRQNDALPLLAPGKSREYCLDLEIISL